MQISQAGLSLLLALIVSGCGTAPEPPAPEEIPLRSGNEPDFSGHWEKDYRLSDDFNSRFELYIADIQRRYNGSGSRNDLQSISGIGGRLSNETINGLARFAEELTRMPLLDIEQDENGIAVERDKDFTLRCRYRDRQYLRDTNPFGADLCGWNDQRLLFRMSLRGGLDITHQFSLSPDRNMLDITTTVSSDAVAAPIVIRNVYQRYELPEQDYNCTLTLTRNRVCSQRGNSQ